MAHGIVVDHKESGVRYAISEINFNSTVHDKVRELRAGETVLGYKPKPKEALGDQGSPSPTPKAANDQAVVSGDSQPTPKTTLNTSK